MPNKHTDKLGFVARNRAASATGRSAMDAWHQYLISSAGLGDGRIVELEKRWLKAKGGSGEKLSDLWSSYLTSKGITGGSLGDRKRRFFESGSEA